MSKMLVDTDAIRTLADILTETGLSEIEITDKDHRIRVARTVSGTVAAAPVTITAPAAPGTDNSSNATAHANSNSEDLSKHPGAVLSPMIGVAYLTPEPSSPPFISVGQQVQEGQTLMLIEAMKTFNQIRAPKAGTVKQILVTSGNPVEYGEVLAVIE